VSALSIQHLVKAYVPGKPVLRDISLDIAGSGITAIIGPSGTGKSTLIRCINRLINPTSGAILFEKQDLATLSGAPLRAARRRIGMVFQEYNLVERLTVMENVLSGRLGYVSTWTAWRRAFDDADIQKAFDLLQRVGLADFANRRADELSGGQRQRVGIARAVMQSPGLLLADEPTSSLDPKTSVEIMELMRDLAAENNIPVVINIHQVQLAQRFAQRVIGMSGGLVVYDGGPTELDKDRLQAIYGGEQWLAT
jgi:phosphonate transport system ATP-binding protein